MALHGSLQSGAIFKEGYLTQEWNSILKSDAKKWWELKEDQGAVFSRFKDRTKKTLEKKILGSEIEKVEVDRQKHDNYISIKRGKKILHLRAENRQQRDEWYEALRGSLGQAPATAAGSDDDVVPVRRRRIHTDTSDTKPPVRRGRSAGAPQTTPNLDTTFRAELNDVVPSLPQLNTIPEDADDSEVAKVGQAPLCCVRHHVVACNDEGKNMADSDVVYENVHFVRSEEEHLATIALRKGSLAREENVYTLHHGVAKLQADNENAYETVIVGGNQERDDSYNNLSPSQDRVPPPFDHNIPAEGNDSASERNSQSSIEDNTQVPDATVKRVPPPVPVHTGQQLRKKIQKLKEEQRQLHGIEKTFNKTSLVGERVKIKLMEKKDGIWVIGLDEGGMQLRGFLKVGDQLIKVNKQALTSAMYARETIRSTDEDQVTLVLKRIPHGFVCSITRLSPNDDLGITVEGNEIISVLPYGLASSRGDLKPQTTGVSGHMCNWAITEINGQPVDLFASTEDISEALGRAGKDVALVVQPVDFIQMMRENLNSESSSTITS
ncbi:uncharacterized protein LOC119739990 [Patiria miniata]|uniref:PH domain-containing protein n=1 Tax=Patiria miniata TaxID=46514 RepID=A0A914B571_PATMI|nr:uncharacterized protein LOC119739990 [Patiria miniata]